MLYIVLLILLSEYDTKLIHSHTVCFPGILWRRAVRYRGHMDESTFCRGVTINMYTTVDDAHNSTVVLRSRVYVKYSHL